MSEETDSAFTEIQNVGMVDIGTTVSITMDGSTYTGIINDADTQTQMLTGSYQGRAVLSILATRSQFSVIPAQRGTVLINSDGAFIDSEWQRKQVDIYGPAHYEITLIRQQPSQ